ncbi:Fcf2 pre-rRNA processing-domain-containing protein [Jimgerdemannia flammicorona]|uniref:Fcf2 pre-rRNA processing-domain-containing protein n=1 Tax=Jimgerdemannia flammicorona TaxID=994334 RepID=A0A433DF00_9FUNG|nr:Fcf2 pre-rRNA processing-domain-containing protein [Jimgerdemannia flammicorona]
MSASSFDATKPSHPINVFFSLSKFPTALIPEPAIPVMTDAPSTPSSRMRTRRSTDTPERTLAQHSLRSTPARAARVTQTPKSVTRTPKSAARKKLILMEEVELKAQATVAKVEERDDEGEARTRVLTEEDESKAQAEVETTEAEKRGDEREVRARSSSPSLTGSSTPSLNFNTTMSEDGDNVLGDIGSIELSIEMGDEDEEKINVGEGEVAVQGREDVERTGIGRSVGERGVGKMDREAWRKGRDEEGVEDVSWEMMDRDEGRAREGDKTEGEVEGGENSDEESEEEEEMEEEEKEEEDGDQEQQGDYDDDDDDEDLDELLKKAEHSLTLKKRDTPKLPKLNPGLRISDALYIRQDGRTGTAQIAAAEVVLQGEDKGKEKTRPALQTLVKRKDEEERKLSRKEKVEERAKTAGPSWFSMSAPELTPELKRDLQLIKLRSVLDPKRHYKKDNVKGLPKYFEMGTIIEGPTEFYSSRLTRRERKSTIVDELAADVEARRYYKRKFLEVQEMKQAGGKRHYKKVKRDRAKSWEK